MAEEHVVAVHLVAVVIVVAPDHDISISISVIRKSIRISRTASEELAIRLPVDVLHLVGVALQCGVVFVVFTIIFPQNNGTIKTTTR